MTPTTTTHIPIESSRTPSLHASAVALASIASSDF